MYLVMRINGEAGYTSTREPATGTKAHRITPAAIQWWNVRYGVERVTAALRLARGFGPPDGITNPYAYVAGILSGSSDG